MSFTHLGNQENELVSRLLHQRRPSFVAKLRRRDCGVPMAGRAIRAAKARMNFAQSADPGEQLG